MTMWFKRGIELYILAVTGALLIFAPDKETMEGNGGVPFFFYHDSGNEYTGDRKAG